MNIPDKAYEALVKRAIDIVPKDVYTDSNDFFVLNPETCFKELFLVNRHTGIKSISFVYPQLKSLVDKIDNYDDYKDAANFKKFVKIHNNSILCNELSVLGEHYKKESLTENAVKDELHFLVIGYQIFLGNDIDNTELEWLYEKSRFGNEWKKNIFAAVLWMRDINGFRKRVDEKYNLILKNTRAKRTVDEHNMSLYDKCLSYCTQKMHSLKNKDNPELLFAGFFVRRIDLIMRMAHAYEDMDDVVKASSFTDNFIKSLLKKHLYSKSLSMIKASLSIEQTHIAFFNQKHPDALFNLDYSCFYAATETCANNMSLPYAVHALDNDTINVIVRSTSEKMLYDLEGYFESKKEKELLKAFFEAETGDELAEVRLQVFCSALWFGNYMHFRNKLIDSIDKIKEAEEKRRLEKAEDAQGIHVGKIVRFGKYKQGSNGEVERIEWKILAIDEEKGTALLVSNRILEGRSFFEEEILLDKYGNEEGKIDWEKVEMTWADSTIRKWLNEDFLNEAFDPDEQNYILKFTIKTDPNYEFGTSGGIETEDKIFLLSLNDVINLDYGFASDVDEEDIERRAAATVYAREKNVKVYAKNLTKDGRRAGCWWLRSPGSCAFETAIVRQNGKVDVGGSVVGFEIGGIRPALYVDLESLLWLM